MSGLWHPNDLVTDRDLLAYEPTVLTQFAQLDWQQKRQKAMDDWLMPRLEQRGYPADRFRTRATPDVVFDYNGSTYTDQTAAAGTVDGLNLASLLSASTKYLYVGADVPFRGVSVRVHDSPNSASVTLTTEVWADAWTTPPVVNSTLVGAKPLAKGGSITWDSIEGVVRRIVNSSDSIYWVRLSMSGAPTGCTAGPVSVVRRSRLAAAATYRTLMLIYQSAAVGQEGPWESLYLKYKALSEESWETVADQIGPEFDTDGDDVIGEDETAQDADEVTGGGWTLERY